MNINNSCTAKMVFSIKFSFVGVGGLVPSSYAALASVSFFGLSRLKMQGEGNKEGMVRVLPIASNFSISL